MIRFVPGLIAAVAAYIAAQLLAWMPLVPEFLIFVAVYLAVAMFVDKSMRGYAGSGRG
jgi:hypothetical protein